MDPLTHLEYALFQLTPTRTRCDLLIFSGHNKEKLASGLVEPFVSHLKFFKDQISKGGYSITLRPPTTSSFWFTKFTFQRLVRFINSPEVLERFIRLEREILQIENSNNSNDGEEHGGEAGSLSSDGSTKKSDPSKLKAGEDGDNVQEESSKIQLQRLLETRKAMLRKEQAMAYARALVAGFETENMNDLILFADSFGASRLREACIEFIELCKKKNNDGLWMDELAAMAAYPPSELAYTGTSGILIATESNASTLMNDLNSNPEDSTDQPPSTPANVPMQMPWPNQMPQYMYNFPGPQGPRYPYPYPGMPPYYPPHMSWPANDDSSRGRHHRSSSKKKSKSHLPESSEEEEDDSNEDADSDSVSDSGTVSKHEKSTKKNRKKSSKTVVIRNINYITSNRKNSDGGSDDSNEDEVDGVLESLVKHHNKSSKSHEKKKKVNSQELDDESGKKNENWDAFQNLLLKDDVEDDHFSIRDNSIDMGSESFVKNQPKTRGNDSFVVPERSGINESRNVNPQDFENGVRMRGRDSSDGDMVISQRYGEPTDGMTNFRDLGSESSMIRNKREEDWFVVKNSEGTIVNSTFTDDYAIKSDVFSSETTKKVVPIDDSFMVQPQTTAPYDSQWRSTDVSMVEGVTKPDATDGQVKTGFYEPDELYLMVSRDSGVEPPVRSSWTPEMDYGTEVQFIKSEPKPAPVETKDQIEESSPVKAKTKKVVKPKPLSRSLPSDKRLPFVSRPVVHKSKREQEDEIRRKMEEIAIQRQKRIAERTAASSGFVKTRTGAAASPTKPVNQKGVSGQLKKTNSKVTGT